MAFALPDTTGNEPAGPPPGRVYLDHYRLTQAPFAITPDPDFLFTSGGHEQALEKIAYAVECRMGFVLLTGEVGTGKTTVCRTLLDRLGDRAETVYLINPSLSGRELLAGILEDAGLIADDRASKKALIDQLYRYLIAAGNRRPFVVVIDDAQTMAPDALEDLRLLSNLETDKHKLIQVVLSGQPELLDRLGSQCLRQLRQRIAVHCRLTNLSAGETGAYIARRLFVAGNQGQVSVSPGAVRRIHKASGGTPRLINTICDYALTAGYVKDAAVIDTSHVRWALAELKGVAGRPVRTGGMALAAATLLALASASVLTLNGGTLASPLAAVQTPPSIGRTEAAVPRRPADPGLRTTDPDAAPRLTAIPSTTTDPPARGRQIRPAVPADSPPAAPSASYALQLGSFRTPERARQDAARHQANGIPAHWQVVGDGRWYRVVVGRFADVDEAGRYRSERALPDALIIRAPLTVKVLPGQPDVSAGDIREFLSQIGHGCLMQPGPAGDSEIYTGLYGSLEDASSVADRINASGRILAQVVHR